MAVMMVLMLERMEKCPGMTQAAFRPPIFAGTTSLSLFHVSLPPRFAIFEGGVFI
jgi:hypothetical protein